MADSLLSGHLLWLESGCLVLGANMKHVENKTWSTVWTSGHLLWLESGCLVLGANMKHVENKTWSTVWTSGHLLWLESGCLVLGANMKHVEDKMLNHLMISNSDSLVVHRGDCVSLPSWKYSIQTGDNDDRGGGGGIQDFLTGRGGGGGGLAIPSMRSHDSWAFDPPSVQCIQKMKHINKGATIGIRGVGVFLK